ncbi:Polysaccharide deacetylase [Paenibacillus sp. yr247]|nr:Polysaccharide deacetylase [Paenibacillus sp. yr247]
MFSFHPQSFYKDQVAILIYHNISDSAKSNITITTDLFSKQLTKLKKEGYHFITVSDFKTFMAGGPVVDNAVLVTFDDGYKSFYQEAFPIMELMHIPAINFVITKNMDDSDNNPVPFLSRQDIAEMKQKDPAFAFQCHSDSLHSKQNDGGFLLTSFIKQTGKVESEADYKSRIINDTETCINKLQAISSDPIDLYTYPFGAYHKEAADLIHQGGIGYAFTIVNGLANRQDNPMFLPRINAGSPTISPDNLDQLIKRRVVDLQKKFDYVPVRDGVEQIGGTILQDSKKQISLYYNGHHYIVDLKALTVSENGHIVPLQKPLKRIGLKRTLSIGLDDLTKMMDAHIVYDPITQKFFDRTWSMAASE